MHKRRYLAPSLSSPFALEDFEIIRTIGTGSSGRVHLVFHQASSCWFALKVLKKTRALQLGQVQHIKNEVFILSRIHHPLLVTLLGTFQDCLHFYMVMNYVPGGELFSILRRAKVIYAMLFLIIWCSNAIIEITWGCSQILCSRNFNSSFISSFNWYCL